MDFYEEIDNFAQFGTTFVESGENIFWTSWTNRSPKFFEQGAQGSLVTRGLTLFRGPFLTVKVFF